MNDPLIDDLVNDLKPQKPLRNKNLWMHCSIFLLAAISLVLIVLGIRPDYESALQNGAFVWKPMLFLMLSLGSVMAILDLSRPTGKMRKRALFPMIMAAFIFLWQTTVQPNVLSTMVLQKGLEGGSALMCFSTIVILGSLSLYALWHFWLRKTASTAPTQLGLFAGLCVGSLAAGSYALHCTHDAALYIAVFYGAPVALIATAGSFIGRVSLRW